jgi:hypothetical protein
MKRTKKISPPSPGHSEPECLIAVKPGEPVLCMDGRQALVATVKRSDAVHCVLAFSRPASEIILTEFSDVTLERKRGTAPVLTFH